MINPREIWKKFRDNKEDAGNIRPVLRKHPWMVVIFGVVLIIGFPVLYPTALIIYLWKDIKGTFFSYWREAINAITYNFEDKGPRINRVFGKPQGKKS